MKIPYAGEQGIFLAEQGINVPCSAKEQGYLAPECAACSTLSARKRGKAEKMGASDCDDAPANRSSTLNLQAQGSSTI